MFTCSGSSPSFCDLWPVSNNLTNTQAAPKISGVPRAPNMPAPILTEDQAWTRRQNLLTWLGNLNLFVGELMVFLL
jgi:hypothetical protein